jgi:hypothetical protein
MVNFSYHCLWHLTIELSYANRSDDTINLLMSPFEQYIRELRDIRGTGAGALSAPNSQSHSGLGDNMLPNYFKVTSNLKPKT